MLREHLSDETQMDFSLVCSNNGRLRKIVRRHLLIYVVQYPDVAGRLRQGQHEPTAGN
jgi:hypothetical protein